MPLCVCVCLCLCVCLCVSVCLYMCVISCSVMSDSLQLHGREPTRLLCPWDFPGKNTGLGCHFLLQGIFPIQGLNPCLLCLLYWQADSLLLSLYQKPRGKPRLTHINGLLSPRWWWLGKRLNHMGTEWFVGFWWVFFQPQLKINAYEFAGPKATCKIIVQLHVHTHTHTHTHTKPTSTHSAGHSYT